MSMSIAIINDIFSDEDLEHIRTTIANCDVEVDPHLGRSRVKNGINLVGMMNLKIIDKFYDIARDLGETSLVISGITCVEYSNLYGKPNLPTHFDVDNNDLIINIQIDSNTVWPLGLNLDIYELKNNSALIFNANKEVHWRTHKEFKDGEYVRMMFVRFCNPENMSDYSYLSNHPDDEIFKEAREFRDSLKFGEK